MLEPEVIMRSYFFNCLFMHILTYHGALKEVIQSSLEKESVSQKQLKHLCLKLAFAYYSNNLVLGASQVALVIVCLPLEETSETQVAA